MNQIAKNAKEKTQEKKEEVLEEVKEKEKIRAVKTVEEQRVIGKPFEPGQSGNPNGRPKGSGLSITTEIKNKLKEVPEGKDKASYLQKLIEVILEKALKEKDHQTIKQIWNYIDGMPVQSTKLSGDPDNPIIAKVVFLPQKKDE